MFKNNIYMYGKHAEYLKKYSVDKQAEDQFVFNVTDNDGVMKTIHIFDNMIQCYMVSIMIGIIENRTAAEDKQNGTQANMFAEVVMKNANLLKRITQMMILSENNSQTDLMIKKAFTIDKDENEIMTKLNAFARGGLEIIDEYFGNCNTYEDVANKILILNRKYNTETSEVE